MRYSLRNQHKIKERLGEPFLNCLIQSLNEHFKKHTKIEEIEYEKEPYKIIWVNNIQPKTDSTFELYVISKTFDVYNLAYKSCMS
jgi:hypothetical protein